MTTPITFPSAALTPLGATLLAEGIDENLWATFTPPGGGQSIIFYLKGGLSSIAPGVPGLDGVVIQSTSGLTAPFKHIDLQAARQDGVTNTGSVYDPAVITLIGEMHAATPQGLDAVRDAWMGAWNPRITGVLEYITIDGGYWRADVRLESTWQDTIKLDRRYLYRPMTHKCRLDNAFWFGVASTDSFQPSYTTFGDTFTTDPIVDPITVVQTAYGASLPLSFASPVTAGNTVVVIAAGQTEDILSNPQIGGPTLDSHSVDGSFTLWNEVFGLFTEVFTSALTSDSVLAGWVLPNCAAANGISFTAFDPAPVGIVAYEVSGLGSAPTLDVAASADGIGSAVSSGPAAPTTQPNTFVVGGASIFDGAAAGASGFTNAVVGTDAWAGYQIPTTLGGEYTWAQTGSASGTWVAGVAALASSIKTAPLSDDWTVTYSSGHTGTIEVEEGIGAFWQDTGNSTQTGLAVFNTPTDTNFQIVSIQIGGSFENFTLGGQAATIIRGRIDDAGNEVRCTIYDTYVTVSRLNSGTETVMYTTDLLIAPLAGEVWTFYVGVQLSEPRSYSVSRSGFELFGINFDGHTLFTFTEVGTGSVVGASNRGVGFGMQTAVGLDIFGDQLPQDVPAPLGGFAAADNITIAEEGFVQLSNIGTEEGWPQYVCTGPGTFGFGDVGQTAPSISFGPLADGQTAVITTLPRLRSATDAADPTNNLYPLLNGRFQNPIPGVPLPSQATPTQIAVSVTNGSALSKIVATVTPRRIHPV